MTLIYYFSGSGNSLALAKDLAAGLDAELQAMAEHAEGVRVPEEVEAVGFVFPSHDFQAPTFVQSWLSGTDGLAGKYLFAVMSYGISPGRGLSKLEALIAKRGGRLAAGFAVMMPHNGIGSRLQPPEVRSRLLEEWQERRPHVLDAINRREDRVGEAELSLLGFFRNDSWRMLPGLFRFIGAMMREGEKGLTYNADEACNACGICARVCPVGNIRMDGGRPVWGSACVNCFACLHWCPQEATHLGTRDLKIDHLYRHPDVTVKEMIGS